MFDKVLDDLKYCKRILNTIDNAGDGDLLIESVISRIEDSLSNLSRIEDSLSNLNMSYLNKPKKRQDGTKFKTAGELLEFLLGLSNRDLNKPVVLGRNEYDFSSKWMVTVRGITDDADWVRNYDDVILICS